MDDRERAKRNRPSLLLLIGVMIPTFLLLTKVFNLGVNWSFLIGLLVAVGINLAIKRPWDAPSDEWPRRRERGDERDRQP